MSAVRSKSCLRFGLAWQAHRKHRAFAQLTRYRHIPAHHARKLARNGKSKASAAEAVGSRGIGLRKFLEQFRLLLGGHANTAVSNRDLEPVASIDEPSRLELDLAFLC